MNSQVNSASVNEIVFYLVFSTQYTYFGERFLTVDKGILKILTLFYVFPGFSATNSNIVAICVYTKYFITTNINIINSTCFGYLWQTQGILAVSTPFFM